MYVCRYVFMFMYMYVYVNKHMYKPYVCISICIPIYIERERERGDRRGNMHSTHTYWYMHRLFGKQDLSIVCMLRVSVHVLQV